MWVIFTYLYNSVLILFIAVHLLVGALITFGVGVYVGIYLSQNYEIPRIDEPFKLWSYFVKFLEQRKKPGALSIFQLSRSSSTKKEPPQPAGKKISLTTEEDAPPPAQGKIPGNQKFTH